MSELTHEETKAQVQIAEKCDPYSMVEIPATTYLHLARMANRKVWPRKGPGLDGLWAVFVPKSLYTESDAPIVTVNYESAEEAMAAVDHNWPGKDDEPAGGEDETEDWATRYWRERCIAKECELESMRRALSRTSDEGTGYNEVAGEVYQAVGVLLSDAGRFDDPDGIALLDACSYLAGNRDNPPDSLLPFESKGTGYVVPEAIKRLPGKWRSEIGSPDGFSETAAIEVHSIADELDRAIAEQGGQR